MFKALLSICLMTSLSFSSYAEEQDYEVSPKNPWEDISNLPEERESSVLENVLMYIPNRVLDFIDIFKADIGVGSSAGAIIRVTEYGQVGIRSVSPASYRLGLLGRETPYLVERSNEMGLGPYFCESQERKVCPTEVGAGLDLFLFGAYIGVCPDELVDFALGIFLVDVKDDDL